MLTAVHSLIRTTIVNETLTRLVSGTEILAKFGISAPEEPRPRRPGAALGEKKPQNPIYNLAGAACPDAGSSMQIAQHKTLKDSLRKHLSVEQLAGRSDNRSRLYRTVIVQYGFNSGSARRMLYRQSFMSAVRQCCKGVSR